MATFELPAPPDQAPVVDASRKITVPWKDWIINWLTLLQAAIQSALDALAPLGALAEITDESSTTDVALIGTTYIDLGRGRRGGSFIVEGSFVPSQIGAPVLTQLFPLRGDEAEGVLTCARAIVLDQRRMRVHWSASSPLAGKVVVHFAIGGTA